MEFKQSAGLIAGMMAATAYVPYIRSIIRGRSRPSPVSWFIWAILSALIFATHWAAGGRSTAWLPGVHCLFTSLVFTLACGQGVRGTSRLDLVCLLAALSGIVAWGAASAPVAALLLFLLADLLASVPTLNKSVLTPFTEDALAWTITFGACAVNLLAVGSWADVEAIYPLYFFAVNGLIAGSLWAGQSTRTASTSTGVPPYGTKT